MAINRDQVLALHARLTAERAKTRVASQKREMEVMQLMMATITTPAPRRGSQGEPETN